MKNLPARLGLTYVSLIIGVLILTGASDARIDSEKVVAMWLFDEGKGDVAADSSGNGHDGAFNGNVDWTKGKFGEALQFDGTSAYVNAGVVPLPENSFSVCLWVYMDDVPAGWVADDINAIMSKGLQGAAPVSQAGKLAATWSSIKNH